MSQSDREFAKRSVQYLRARGLRPTEIEQVLRSEFACAPSEARQLIQAA